MDLNSSLAFQPIKGEEESEEGPPHTYSRGGKTKA